MRIKPVLVFLGAAAVATCALAEPTLPVTVQGGASPLVHLTPDEAHDAAGSFKLEDGRMLKLSSRSSKVYMELDGRREQLLPVAQTRFVARTSGDQLALDELHFPQTVTLTQLRR